MNRIIKAAAFACLSVATAALAAPAERNPLARGSTDRGFDRMNERAVERRLNAGNPLSRGTPATRAVPATPATPGSATGPAVPATPATPAIPPVPTKGPPPR